MKKNSRLRARAAAIVTSMGVALTGSMVLGAAPARADLSETDFAFQTTAFGSRLIASDIAFRSARSAYSFISCTRLAGLERANALAEVQVPDAKNPQISIKGIRSWNETYRFPRKRVVGTRGVNTIAEVMLGGSGGAHLTLEGLRVAARAEHTPQGWRTATPISWAKLSLVPATGTPLDDAAKQLMDAIDTQVVGNVIAVLEEAGGPIEIPGLGTISLGWQRQAKRAAFAEAGAYALRIQLYGKDAAPRGGDDSEVQLGRAWARINKNAPAGVFTGSGWATEMSALGGAVKSDRNPVQPLPCAGTGGRTRTASLVGGDLGGLGQLVVQGANGRANGLQREDGSAVAWTEGSLAKVVLGGADSGLVLQGVVGRANLRQTRAGKIHVNAQGTTIGSMTVAGTPHSIPDPGQPMEIPGVGKLEFNKVSRTKRGIQVSAVVITLLEGDATGTVIKLGNAQVRINRY